MFVCIPFLRMKNNFENLLTLLLYGGKINKVTFINMKGGKTNERIKKRR